MNAREKAETLRQEAIQELLTERQAIDEMLKSLGHGKSPQMNTPTPLKRRGRPPKPEGLAQQPRGDRDPTETASA